MTPAQLTRPLNAMKPLLWMMAALVWTLALVLAILCWRTGKAGEWLHDMASPPAVARLPKSESVEISSKSDLDGASRADELARGLNRQWLALLQAFERASQKDITVLELHPNLANGQFSATGEARSYQAMQSFVTRLNATGLVKNATLVHEQGFLRDNLETVGFSVEGELVAMDVHSHPKEGNPYKQGIDRSLLRGAPSPNN